MCPRAQALLRLFVGVVAPRLRSAALLQLFVGALMPGAPNEKQWVHAMKPVQILWNTRVDAHRNRNDQGATLTLVRD